MKPFSFRHLTPAELALASEMFGAGLDAGRIRLFAIPLWPRAFVAGPALIAWPARQLPADLGESTLRAQATFVHELTHVWQAQNGVGLIRAKLRAGDGAAAYAYELAADTDFAALNIEQQAMVVEHAFLASRGRPTPFAAEFYVNAASGWRRV